MSGCDGCFVYAATSSSAYEDDAGTMTIVLGKSGQANFDITEVFVTAYSIMAAMVEEASCVGLLGVPVMLPDPYHLVLPTTISSSDSSDIQAYIQSQILTSLEKQGCGQYEQNIVTSSTSLVAVVSSTTSLITTTSASLAAIVSSTTSLMPAPSASLPEIANSTTSPKPQSSSSTGTIGPLRLEEPTQIGIGVGVFFATLFLVSLVAFIWHKGRLRSAAITAEKQAGSNNKRRGTSVSEGHNQPYLQNKAELEAEDRQKHELEARQRIYELDGENGLNKVSAGIFEHRLAVMRSKQELTGGEHGQELDA